MGAIPFGSATYATTSLRTFWPHIDFVDDREGCLFTATVHRKAIEGPVEVTELPESSGKRSGKRSGKPDNKVLKLLSDRPEMTIPELAEALGITTRGVEKQIVKLRAGGHLRRIGPAKDGHWEVAKNGEG
jgi:ATP-dependent DNA helicase RecG